MAGAHARAASWYPGNRAAASTAVTTRAISAMVSAGTNTGTFEKSSGCESARLAAKPVVPTSRSNALSSASRSRVMQKHPLFSSSAPAQASTVILPSLPPACST